MPSLTVRATANKLRASVFIQMNEDYEFDTNEFPLAYLVTIRCYGTWLHGDKRGSFDRRSFNKYDFPCIVPDERFENYENSELKHAPVKFEAEHRKIIGQAIREVCLHREYQLKAINVRTNHVHTVVSAASKPEKIMNTFKAYSTRRLRDKKMFPQDTVIWSRHGSTIYLWKEPYVGQAIEYVVSGQGKIDFSSLKISPR